MCIRGRNSEDIIVFWRVTYDDYLIVFLADNHSPMFPSQNEKANIFNWLPNWKAAGIDGIYDCFHEETYNSSQIFV
ncbi:hypothetical protein CWI36_0120p0020 [Hamiltosporidium magnivora]|uniref:Uncharacterized protein n=1 Tax=Hamiltosporidium magnivora TaxID=148818 RepID=A0A4Q9LK09_9MICR|nr:hypothetical protein CWI36_0120p0020 [Hamiltosporidium magnivora]